MTDRALVGYDQLLETLEVEGDRLASATRGTDPELYVQASPGMRLGEVVRHVGSVYRMVVSWLRAGDRPVRWQRAPVDGQTLEDYLRVGLREIVGELAAHDPEEGCPTWWPQHQRYGFWYRRLAHETTIHRFDVQYAATGGATVGGIAPEIALDGIDELLSLWFTHRLGVLGVVNARPGVVAVEAGEWRWLAKVTATGTGAWRVGNTEPADVTVRSDPVGTYLWLWGRHPWTFMNVEEPAVRQLYHLLRVATT